MEIGELIARLRATMEDFFKNEADLISQNPHEDSLTGHLLGCIMNHFSGLNLNIDTQYNKRILENEVVNKQTQFLIDTLPIKKWPQTWENGQLNINKEILPDIIIHQRINGENNFLAIEIKKVSNVSAQDRTWDDLKLKAMTGGDLNYDFGLFLDINTKVDVTSEDRFSMRIYEKGEVVYQGI